LRALVLLPLSVLASPALAQQTITSTLSSDGGEESEAATPIDEWDEPLVGLEGEILVVATRLRGQVEVPQAPLLVLDEADIEAYGAESISDLLAQLAPQTGTGRGRGGGHPITLVNGRRISSFREIRDLPPEAIRRMEILPEEVALRFGYAPNQRVVNFILKDNFSSRTVAAEYEPATRGGTVDSELEATLLRIDGQSRFNVTGKVNDTTMLTEAERDVIQPDGRSPTVADDPDPARFRSLVAASRAYSLNGTWSTGLGEGANAAALTINGAVTRTDSRSLDGLDTFELVAPAGASEVRSLPDPLTRLNGTTTIESGLVFNKPLGGWNLTATADGSYSDSRTRTDRPRDEAALAGLRAAAAAGTLALDGPLPAIAPGGQDRARTQAYGVNSLVTLSGVALALPAGEVATTFKGGLSYNRSDNVDTRAASDLSLDRSSLSGGVNIGLPIASRRNGVLGGVGDITLNLSAGLTHLSDFGTLKDWSAGMNWAPTEKLSFQASYIVDEAAPSLGDLANPLLPSFNVAVFDFVRGETALVTVLNGGNPELRRERQRDIKLSGNWQLPFFKNNSNLLLEYFRNRSSDVTQSFPSVVTSEIENAFPRRVTRDPDGRLILLDRRPVTFDEVNSSRIRWGLNVAGTIGKPQPGGQREGAVGAGEGRPGGMGRPAGGGGPRGMGPRGPGGRGGPGGNGQGRWNLSLAHTVELTNTVLIAPGVPVLDQLDGDALNAGGVARHGLELEGGTFYRGFGLRFNGNWSSPVTVRSQGADDLRFGSVVRLNLRAFVNFGQQPKLVEDVPFLKGARLMIKIDNVLDQRQRVTDPGGNVPLGYQVAYRDPRGRVIGLDFRKMF
jgi:iron complex outermembrane recepter protein